MLRRHRALESRPTSCASVRGMTPEGAMAPLPAFLAGSCRRGRVTQSWLSRSTAYSGLLLVLLRLTLLLQSLLRRLLLIGLLRVLVLSRHRDLLVAELPIVRNARGQKWILRRFSSGNSTPCRRRDPRPPRLGLAHRRAAVFVDLHHETTGVLAAREPPKAFRARDDDRVGSRPASRS